MKSLVVRYFRIHRTLLSVVFLLSASSVFSQAQPSDGKASYYARKFQGRVTASGEKFDTFDYTAAHRTLPFNTYVNVTNVKNGLNVIVRINDRGPYAHNRVIDLSEAAARRIGGYQHGLVHVKVEVLNWLQMTPALDSIFHSGEIHDCLGNPGELSGFSLSLWSTTDLLHAVYVANDLYLKESIKAVFIAVRRVSGKNVYHVVVTGYDTDASAVLAKEHYEKQGFMEVSYFRP